MLTRAGVLALLATSACSDDATPAGDETGSTGEDTGMMTAASTLTGMPMPTTMTSADDTTGGGDTTDGGQTTDDGATTMVADDTTGDGATTDGGETTESGTTGGVCGDGVIDVGEDCDTDDLAGETCETMGRGTGDLACADDCTFDVSGCAMAAMCGNNVVEAGEACDDANAVDGDGCNSQCEVDGADTCEAPNYIYEVPYSFSGDTANFGNQYAFVAGSCPTDIGSDANSAANDVVFSFTPEVSGLYTMVFDVAFDGIIYIVTDCADTANTCVQAADGSGSGETLYADLVADTTYYIIMGHWATTAPSAEEGPFTFTVDSCVPMACDGVFCGDDGCGGSCACAAGEVCDIPDGMTDGTCAEAPPGDTCDVGIVIDPAALPYSDMSDTLLYNNDYGYSEGVCPGETGGWNSGAEDVVYTFTPDVSGIYTIEFVATWDSTIYMVTDCANVDGTCVAAADAEFGNDDPEVIVASLTAGTTYFIIGGHWQNTTPGQGGTYTINVSAPCQPIACDGVACGDDGCGGTCSCNAGEVCDAGTCGPIPPGDTCADGVFIDSTALPYVDSGDTLIYNNDYGYSSGVCPGETGGGNQANTDVVYEFTPGTSGVYTIVFDTTYNSTVYVVTDCTNVDGSCVGGADNGNPETVLAELTAGTTYFIIGGALSNFTSGLGGPYTLSVSDACIPAVCDNVTCGDDGCGGTCGCGAGDICDSGACVAAPQGDTCLDPFVVGALPFSDSNDTDLFNNHYGYAPNACPGESGGFNGGAEDVVYSFTPPADGNYSITFDATWDSTVYIVTDCGNVNGTCVGGADNGNPETITTDLVGGQTYFIIGGHWSNSSLGGGGAYTLNVVQN